jgi:pantoate kinase
VCTFRFVLYARLIDVSVLVLQIQGVSVEYEGLKKSLGASETAKEIDETEKRLKVRTVPYWPLGLGLCLSVRCVGLSGAVR